MTEKKQSPQFLPEPISGQYDKQVNDAWKSSLPDLDPTAIPLLALLDVTGALVQRFHHSTLKRLGHNYNEYVILSTLLLNDGGLKPSVFTDILGKASAGTTQTLNKLEKMGLIERKKNPEDKRSVLVELTSKGKKKAYELCSAESEQSARLFSGLGKTELAQLQRNMNELISLLRP